MWYTQCCVAKGMLPDCPLSDCVLQHPGPHSCPVPCLLSQDCFNIHEGPSTPDVASGATRHCLHRTRCMSCQGQQLLLFAQPQVLIQPEGALPRLPLQLSYQHLVQSLFTLTMVVNTLSTNCVQCMAAVAARIIISSNIGCSQCMAVAGGVHVGMCVVSGHEVTIWSLQTRLPPCWSVFWQRCQTVL